MPWTTDIRDRDLIVDLSLGVQGDEWEELLDYLMHEISKVDRVRLEVPASYEFGNESELLDTLIHVITRRGVNVERRFVER